MSGVEVLICVEQRPQTDKCLTLALYVSFGRPIRTTVALKFSSEKTRSFEKFPETLPERVSIGLRLESRKSIQLCTICVLRFRMPYALSLVIAYCPMRYR